MRSSHHGHQGRDPATVSPRSSTRSPVSRPRTSSSTSRSSTTSTSTRCPWSRSSSPPRRSFGVKIPDDEVKNLKTVGDAVTTSRTPRPDHHSGGGGGSSRPTGPPSAAGHRRAHVREEAPVTAEQPHRGRHRTRRHHAARRRRRLHLGGHARRPVRRPPRSTEDWAADLPVKIAGRTAVEPTEVLDPVEARRLDRSAQFALIAAREAWADAGLEPAPTIDPERLGAVVASGIGGVTTLLDQLRHAAREGRPPGLPARRADADAERPGRQRRPRVRRPGRRAHPGLRLRLRRRGDRLRARP